MIAMSNGAITTLIKQTLWDWACTHHRTKDVIFLEQAHDDMSYPLRILLAAFGLFPDAAPVRAALQTLERGYYIRGVEEQRHPTLTGHQLLTLLPLSPLPVARHILALRKAGHLVGDIPSGVQRLRALATALQDAVEQEGCLPINEECAELTGYVFYLPTSLPQLLMTLRLDPEDPALGVACQAIYEADGYSEEDIWRFALSSSLPEAQAWYAWYTGEFLPALRVHHWYAPESGHAIPPRQELGACTFYAEWQDALTGSAPIDVAIVPEFEMAASYPDGDWADPFAEDADMDILGD
jgi:hypothetical protein